MIEIRPCSPVDQAAIDALETRIDPYRPEDAEEVEAMYRRAQNAQREGNPRWMAPVSRRPRAIEQEFNAFWIAESEEPTVPGIAGMIGVQAFDGFDVLADSHPLAAEWWRRNDVAELRRLRVAPEARRQGLGRRLSQVVIDWARSHGFRLLVVNTTTPQRPALQLYRSLGFQEAGFSFVGQYELVWLELPLTSKE